MKYILLLLLILPGLLFSAPKGPAVITDLSSTLDSNNVLLNWSIPESNCIIKSYVIYKSTTFYSGRGKWKNTVSFISTSTQFLIVELIPNRYYFGIKTIDICGNISKISNIVSAKIENMIPLFRDINISWTMPDNWMISPNNYNLEGINLYVGIKIGGPYNYINVIDAGYVLNHTIFNLPDNENEYCIVATAYGKHNVTNEFYESKYSNEICK